MNTKLLLTFIGFFLSSIVYGIEESNYQQEFQNTVWPYFQSGQTLSMISKDHLNLNGMAFFNKEISKPTCMILLPGRQEPVEKYAEVIYDIKHQLPDIALFIIDHRGQGHSTHMTKNPQIGYVDRFEDYIDDVGILLKEVVQLTHNSCQKMYLLGHSMGAAIGIGAVLRYPQYFDGLFFISPMWQIITKPYSETMALNIVNVATFLGQGKKYALKQENLNTEIPFPNNNLTHSLPRYQMMMDLYRKFPETKVGGVSNRWLQQAIRYTKKIRDFKTTKELSIPTYIFQADQDALVDITGQNTVCFNISPHCEKEMLSNTYHELLMEKDGVRQLVLQKIINIMK